MSQQSKSHPQSSIEVDTVSGLHEPVHSGNEFVVELRNLATLILRGRFRWTTDRTSC